MATLVVGDLHLMAGLILPMIEKKMKDREITEIIFTGDYCDQWSQQNNLALYIKDLEFLLQWRKKQEAQGIKVTNLIGNHDIPYIIHEPVHYSLIGAEGQQQVHKLLLELQPQIACWSNGFLISHGGYLCAVKTEPWHFETITEDLLLSSPQLTAGLEQLANTVGACRGGRHQHGGPLWADILAEFPDYPSEFYPKQVVGHRPLSEVTTAQDGDNQMIGIDTFTVIHSPLWPHFHPHAAMPGCLLIDDGQTSSIMIEEWVEEGIDDKIMHYFTT